MLAEVRKPAEFIRWDFYDRCAGTGAFCQVPKRSSRVLGKYLSRKWPNLAIRIQDVKKTKETEFGRHL